MFKVTPAAKAVLPGKLLKAVTEAGILAEKITEGDINLGGCAVYAYLLAQRIERAREDGKLPVEAAVATFGPAGLENPTPIDEARAWVEDGANATDWADEGIEFFHVTAVVKAGGNEFTVDTTGIAEAHRAPKPYNLKLLRHPGEFTLTEAKDLALQAPGWNHTFNREHIPLLHKTIDVVFAGNGL
jgi:hypothetical protein